MKIIILNNKDKEYTLFTKYIVRQDGCDKFMFEVFMQRIEGDLQYSSGLSYIKTSPSLLKECILWQIRKLDVIMEKNWFC